MRSRAGDEPTASRVRAFGVAYARVRRERKASVPDSVRVRVPVEGGAVSDMSGSGAWIGGARSWEPYAPHHADVMPLRLSERTRRHCMAAGGTHPLSADVQGVTDHAHPTR